MKIKQFELGQFGEIYFLLEDGTMIMGEMEHVETPDIDPLRQSDIKINITKKIILPN